MIGGDRSGRGESRRSGGYLSGSDIEVRVARCAKHFCEDLACVDRMVWVEFKDILAAAFGFADEEAFCLRMSELQAGAVRSVKGSYLESDFVVRPIPLDIVAVGLRK